MNAVRHSDVSVIPHLRTLGWAGFLLGVAMGGFFDGILLHQVLQWHHLLSLVPGEPWRDIKVQILADGLFHMLMYLIAVIGLWKLWKAREVAASGDRVLLASSALGFGVFNIVDAAVFHWILRFHRIRLDTDNPLFWDLLWFVVFGLAFVALAWWLQRGSGPIGGKASTATLALAVLVGGPVAALPPQDADTVMVFFKPGTTPAQVFAGIDAVDGRILWAAPQGDVWALDVRDKSKTAALYRHGAFLVSNSALAVGCVKWTSARG
ncbi:DUF2243 domain-containing protein [Massilia niabensis]|uniref:DUF2243 domain-containing protein n=1 Tax=Massilia niabensis TaxID=544910 RepID=A0ABW0L904_9BURK